MNIKSEKIDGVTCRIGVRTKMPSTVTMAVDNVFIMDAVQLFEALERGETPEHGLVGMKLIAIYAGEESESEPGNAAVVPSGKPLELVVEEEGKDKDSGVVEEDLKDGESLDDKPIGKHGPRKSG